MRALRAIWDIATGHEGSAAERDWETTFSAQVEAVLQRRTGRSGVGADVGTSEFGPGETRVGAHGASWPQVLPHLLSGGDTGQTRQDKGRPTD